MYLSTLLRPGSSGGQLSELTSSDEKYSPDWPGADRSLHTHGAGQEGGGGGAGGEGGLWWGVGTVATPSQVAKAMLRNRDCRILPLLE